MPSGYSASLPTDILLDQGVLYVGSALVAATSDALKFDPGTKRRNVDFAGKRTDIAGLDRVNGWAPKITGTIIQLGASELAILEPGSASAVVSGTTTYTPTAAGVLIPSSALITNLRALWPRGSGGYAAVLFPKAMVTSYTVDGAVDAEAGIPITIEARQDLSVGGATTDDPPYKIELRTTLP